eukprot:gene6747-biopygen13828
MGLHTSEDGVGLEGQKAGGQVDGASAAIEVVASGTIDILELQTLTADVHGTGESQDGGL